MKTFLFFLLILVLFVLHLFWLNSSWHHSYCHSWGWFDYKNCVIGR